MSAVRTPQVTKRESAPRRRRHTAVVRHRRATAAAASRHHRHRCRRESPPRARPPPPPPRLPLPLPRRCRFRRRGFRAATARYRGNLDEKKGEWVRERKAIVRHYLRGSFGLDFVSTFPFDLLEVSFTQVAYVSA